MAVNYVSSVGTHTFGATSIDTPTFDITSGQSVLVVLRCLADPGTITVTVNGSAAAPPAGAISGVSIR